MVPVNNGLLCRPTHSGLVMAVGFNILHRWAGSVAGSADRPGATGSDLISSGCGITRTGCLSCTEIQGEE